MYKYGRLIIMELSTQYTSEQTNSQVKALAFCAQRINDRLIQLWLEKRMYDTGLVRYGLDLSLVTNQHEPDSDMTRLWIGNEADLRVTFHELIHAFASERRYLEADAFKVWNMKSWFHRGVTFKVLNEAITEKIARELYQESHAENMENIYPLFEGRSEKVIKIIEDRYAELIDQITAQNLQSYKDEVRRLRIEYKAYISTARRWDQSKKKKIKNIKNHKKYYLWDQESLKERIHPNSKIQKSLMSWELWTPISLQKDLLQKSYSKDIVSDSYNEHIDLLNAILDCIWIYNSENEKNTWWNKNTEWERLQKAYFTGNSFYLKKMSRFFKKHNIDILKELHSLGWLNGSNEIRAITQKIIQIKDTLIFNTHKEI